MMDIALDRARPGERWVLRTRLPDGSATDVIGWLTGVTADRIALQREGGAVVLVERAAVVVAKRVPAAKGGPDPLRISAAAQERSALPGWLAWSEPLGEWTLRAGGGFTRRANSTLAVGDPALPLAEASDRVISYSLSHGISPLTQVIVGSDVEAGLARLGWQPDAGMTDVLVCRLATLLGNDLPDERVTVQDTLDDRWWRAYRRSRPQPDDPTVARRILDGHPPRAFGSVPGLGGALAGIGRGHVHGPWLGVAAMWVDEAHRRHGLATALLRALGHWGARLGARYAYVQVDRANVGAQKAYGRLGFVVHHSYRYLAPPSDESA